MECLVPCLLPLQQYHFELPMGPRTRRSPRKWKSWFAKTGASLPTDAIPSPLLSVIAKVRYSQYRNGRRHISHSHLNFQVPEVFSEELLLSRSIRSELSRLRCHGHSLLLIFTGSVGRRIQIVVPVDTLYRTSIISSSIVLLLNPFANLSLAPLSLFSIYGPDLGVWPDCWVSAEFLRTPIPRKGSGSTTTTKIFFLWRSPEFCGKFATFWAKTFYENFSRYVLGPLAWGRSVLEKCVLGLGFFLCPRLHLWCFITKIEA